MTATRVVEYLEGEISPFGRWFAALNAPAAAKVDFGPGYRIYFGQEGNTLIILLGGGTKKTQARDIGLAHTRWAAYKLRR
jgi:putative component of toxin-antitoxin plasmid stabilization module